MRFFILLSFLFLAILTIAQADPLPASIGYEGKLHGFQSKYGEDIYVDSNYFPAGFEESKVFFIKVSDDEMKGNKSNTGPFAPKINKKFIQELNKSAPFKFDVYENTEKDKGLEHFLKLGYKYRLRILCNWSEGFNSNGPTLSQKFKIVIHDLESDLVFGPARFYFHPKYQRKFIENFVLSQEDWSSK